MSSVNAEVLLSPLNEFIPFITVPGTGTTAQFLTDSLLNNGHLMKQVRIQNNDNLNNLTYRTQSPSGILRTVPPNSADTLTEWGSYLEINPDGVSGDFEFERDLVLPQNAKPRRKLG